MSSRFSIKDVRTPSIFSANVSRGRDPVAAIVIPVFKHPVFVVEAIGCALREAERSRGVVVIVNDGCPMSETHDVCLSFAYAYPAHVEYIRTPNGGLSAARNCGIKYALARFRSLEAVYLLDADNRLTSGALRRALATMQSAGSDWVYPNIDKFGMEWSGDYSAPYSIFRHLFQNICEAGSLIHRRVFDAGVFFDEQMRHGYEDWEFWLSCIDAGFRGAPCPELGFQYRARRESMVRDSDRVGTEIVAYMRRKHKRLYSWKNIIRLEHRDAPRFCVIDTAHRRYTLTSIPGEAASSGDLVSIDQLFWKAEFFPTHVTFPNFIVIADDRVLRELARARVLDWVFWQIEDLLETHTFAYVCLLHSKDDVSFTVAPFQDTTNRPADGPHILATTLKCVRDVVADSSTSWTDTLRTPTPEPSIAVLTVAAPFSRATVTRRGTSHALPAFFDLLNEFRASPYRQADARGWEWRSQDALLPGRDLFERTRAYMGALGPLGRCALTDEREVAFLLPVVSFGGVEQVAIQVAQQFRRLGWRTRLIVTGSPEIKAPDRLAEAFDVFCFLNDPRHAAWNPSGYKYFGHDLQKWAAEGRVDRLIGLLAGCAAVIGCQAMHGNEVMGWLRRQGVVTVSCLHLIDRDLFGAPQGHPYWMLAYEHAFDLITAPSRQLLAFCHAAGVPREKLVLLENAPTFDADPALRRKRLQSLERAQSGQEPPRKLRVLSMGRLDRQKGVERLAALIRAAAAQNLPIEWRLVGSRVLEEQGGAGAGLSDAPDVTLEPPVFDRAAVIERLLWADVVILLSHWEGSPLAILEAQSLGAIPVATDVGAVGEMIAPGVDGVLIENSAPEAVSSAALNELRRFTEDATLRSAFARSAIARAESLSWGQTAAELVARVGRLADARSYPAVAGAGAAA